MTTNIIHNPTDHSTILFGVLNDLHKQQKENAVYDTKIVETFSNKSYIFISIPLILLLIIYIMKSTN